MSEIMEIATAGRTSRAAVVRVSGRIDARTSQQLIEHCGQVRPKNGHLVLNLGDVTFLSSAGVGALLVLTQQCVSDGGSLHLAPPSHAVRSALELLNLGKFLKIDESEGEALAALGA